MSKLLENAYDPETFRKQGHELVDRLADYLKDCKEEKLKTLPWKEPKDSFRQWETDFNDPTPTTMGAVLDSVIKKSLHLHHPKYMGHQVVPPVPPAALAELVSALLNNSMAVYEVGPAAAAIEKVVTGWLASVLGMGKDARGFLTSGGTSAT